MAKNRDGRGRFVRGWTGGPGAAAHRAVKLRAALQESILRKVTPAKADAVVEMLLERAIGAQDLVAARILAPFILGRPVDTIAARQAHPPDRIVSTAPMTVDDIAGALQEVLALYHSGRLDEASATTTQHLLSTLLQARQASDVDRKLTELLAILQERTDDAPSS
jgi:hypothetical protein